MLHRDLPKIAAALYLAAHVYLRLSTRAAQKLLVTNPGPNQVHELDAKSLKMQGKWAQAEQQYRRVFALLPSACCDSETPPLRLDRHRSLTRNW